MSRGEASVQSGSKVSRRLTICNQRGLHARAAAKFVKLAADFTCDIQVSRCGQTVSGHSIMGLMMLAAAAGTEIEVETDGADAAAAIEAISTLVANKFDEAE